MTEIPSNQLRNYTELTSWNNNFTVYKQGLGFGLDRGPEILVKCLVMGVTVKRVGGPTLALVCLG